MKKASETIDLIKIVRGGFFLNAAIWLVFGIISLLRISGKPGQSSTMLVIAILMFGNMAAFIFCGMTIGRKTRWFFFIALFVLGLNILLTVTDQFGIYDLITLLIDLGILGLLVAARKKFFQT